MLRSTFRVSSVFATVAFVVLCLYAVRACAAQQCWSNDDFGSAITGCTLQIPSGTCTVVTLSYKIAQTQASCPGGELYPYFTFTNGYRAYFPPIFVHFLGAGDVANYQPHWTIPGGGQIAAGLNGRIAGCGTYIEMGVSCP